MYTTHWSLRDQLSQACYVQLNCTRIIEMDGPSTYMINPSAPDKEPRSFAFDFSYDWDVRCAPRCNSSHWTAENVFNGGPHLLFPHAGGPRCCIQ